MASNFLKTFSLARTFIGGIAIFSLGVAVTTACSQSYDAENAEEGALGYGYGYGSRDIPLGGLSLAGVSSFDVETWGEWPLITRYTVDLASSSLTLRQYDQRVPSGPPTERSVALSADEMRSIRLAIEGRTISARTRCTGQYYLGRALTLKFRSGRQQSILDAVGSICRDSIDVMDLGPIFRAVEAKLPR